MSELGDFCAAVGQASEDDDAAAKCSALRQLAAELTSDRALSIEAMVITGLVPVVPDEAIKPSRAKKNLARHLKGL